MELICYKNCSYLKQHHNNKTETKEYQVSYLGWILYNAFKTYRIWLLIEDLDIKTLRTLKHLNEAKCD